MVNPALEDFEEEAIEVARSAEDIEKEIETALSCPCVSDLKEGPCGKQFVLSFSCFLRHSHEPENQLHKCIDAFNDLQECMLQHPEQFADFVEAKPPNEQESQQRPQNGNQKEKTKNESS